MQNAFLERWNVFSGENFELLDICSPEGSLISAKKALGGIFAF